MKVDKEVKVFTWRFSKTNKINGRTYYVPNPRRIYSMGSMGADLVDCYLAEYSNSWWLIATSQYFLGYAYDLVLKIGKGVGSDDFDFDILLSCFEHFIFLVKKCVLEEKDVSDFIKFLVKSVREISNVPQVLLDVLEFEVMSGR